MVFWAYRTLIRKGAALLNVHVGDLVASNSPAANLIPSVDPTDTTKFKFVAGGGGGSGAMTQIAQVTTAGSQSTVTFSGIPGDGTTLILIATGGDTSSGGGEIICWLKLNNDSTSTNYSQSPYSGTVNASANTGQVNSTSNGGVCGVMPGVSGNANAVGQINCTIANYAQTTFYKNVQSLYTNFFGSGPSIDTGNISFVYAGGAITRIDAIAGGTAFRNGSIFTLYKLT